MAHGQPVSRHKGLKMLKILQYSSEMAKSAAVQGLASALIGAYIASKTGVPVKSAAGAGLASGAIVGTGSGAWSTYQRRQAIVKTCLLGRGYKVLE